MRSDNEVIIFQKKRTLPNTLPESLHSKGFRNRTIADLAEMQHAYDDAQNPILLVDGGPEISDTNEIANQLLQQPDAHLLPVIIVARSAEVFEKALSGHFCVAIGVRVPATTADIISALTYIYERYDDFVEAARQKKEAAELELEIPAAEPAPEAREADLVSNFEARQRVQRSNAVPYTEAPIAEADQHFREIFTNMSSMGLMQKPLGGQTFASAVNENGFSDKGYFTLNNDRASMLTEQIGECTSHWDRGHVHRTAFLAWQMGSSLQRTDLAESIREACLIYLAMLLDHPQEYIRRDYFHPRYQNFRGELARRVKEIAFKVGVENDLPLSGKIIGKLSALIGGEGATGEDDVTIAAGIIQGADLVGRTCARRGYFEPELAYDFLRRIRRGVYARLHPFVLSCLVKVLAEAVVATALGLAVPKKKRNSEKVKDFAEQYAEQPIGHDEMRVAIDALTPGMRLSKPIHSFDGREILSGNLVLDQDLIWRIWQLSAIRPLNAPLVKKGSHR